MSDAPQNEPSTPPPPPTGATPPPPPDAPGTTPPPPAPAPPPPGTAPTGPTPPPPGYTQQPGPPAQAPAGAPHQQYSGAPSKDDNTMAMLVHLSALFTGFIGPLIIWLIKKDESPFVDRHGKTALNFMFTLAIAWVATIILFFLLIGFLIAPVLLIVGIVFPIIAAVAANKGEEYTYPAAIKFFN